MIEFQIGIHCCRLECAAKPPTLMWLEAPDNLLTKGEANDTFERLVACHHCGHDNIITLPLKWSGSWLGSFKIFGYHTTDGQSIPVVEGRCLE